MKTDEERRQRLKMLTNSSAFTQAEADNIKAWADSDQAHGFNLRQAFAITLHKVRTHDKTQAPIENLIHALCRKIEFQLAKHPRKKRTRNPTKQRSVSCQSL